MARIRNSSVIIFNRVSDRTRAISTTSMSSIMTSSRMMSHSARAQMASASAPLEAVRTSKYSAESRASNSLTLAGTSSTTRIRADILTLLSDEPSDGLDELADRDRLGQIRLASTFVDAFLVALHCEGGDGHDRYRAQLRIVLDPPRHFEARDLRKLDIHQNEIGSKLAHKIERLETVAGAFSPIAMCLKQIAKELHVELVVFHDQDGFCHPALPSQRYDPGRRHCDRRQVKIAPDSL